MVHAIAWRMLGDAVEAEDVVQETFVKLWVNAKGWTPAGGGLGGWLRRISTNACLDRLRRPRFVSDEGLPERADEAPPADRADRRRAAPGRRRGVDPGAARPPARGDRAHLL